MGNECSESIELDLFGPDERNQVYEQLQLDRVNGKKIKLVPRYLSHVRHFREKDPGFLTLE